MLGHKTKAEVITEANPIANARLGVFAFTQQPPPRRSPPESSALRQVLLRGVMPSSTRRMSKCKTVFLSILVPDSGSGLFSYSARIKKESEAGITSPLSGALQSSLETDPMHASNQSI